MRKRRNGNREGVDPANHWTASGAGEHTTSIAKARTARLKNPKSNQGYRFLAQAFEATADPALHLALRVLAAYGLDGMDCAKRLQRLRREREDGENQLAQAVQRELVDLAKNARGSAKPTTAAKRVASRLGVEGNSFDAARQRVAKAYRDDLEAKGQGALRYVLAPRRSDGSPVGLRPPREQPLNDGYVGHMTVRPVQGRVIIDPATGRQVQHAVRVPNNRFWRQRLAAGDVEPGR